MKGFVNPRLAGYLDQLGYAPGCIVFHTPHIAGKYDKAWWQSIQVDIVSTVTKYQSRETTVTIENMPHFDGYYVPLIQPSELQEFTAANDLGVTLDTTHYAQMGIDIVSAASILRDQIKTIHLSDYQDGVTHVFIGDGALDLENFFTALNLSTLHAITLESSAGYLGENVQAMSRAALVDRLEIAKVRLQNLLATA